MITTITAFREHFEGNDGRKVYSMEELYSIEKWIKSIDFKLSDLDETEYPLFWKKIEQKYGEDIAHLLDKQPSADFLHYHQNAMTVNTGGDDTYELIEMFFKGNIKQEIDAMLPEIPGTKNEAKETIVVKLTPAEKKHYKSIFNWIVTSENEFRDLGHQDDDDMDDEHIEAKEQVDSAWDRQFKFEKDMIAKYCNKKAVMKAIGAYDDELQGFVKPLPKKSKVNEAAVEANPDILKTIQKGDTIIHPNGSEIDPGNYMTLEHTIIRKQSDGSIRFRTWNDVDQHEERYTIYATDVEDFKNWIKQLK